MRIGLGLALGVMLAVYRDPFAGDHARREPQPEAEEMTRDRMQSERAMRLMAMQEDRDARDRHVREKQRDADVAQHRELENAVERHTESHPSLRIDFFCTESTTITGTPASRSTRDRN